LCVYYISLYLELRESNLELKNILPLLREIRPDKIFSLGLQLDVELTELRMITERHKDNLERQIIEIIDFWLQNSKDQSWEGLATAVRRLGGHNQLVSKLENKRCSSEVISNHPGIIGMHTDLGGSINESEDSVGIISNEIQSISLGVSECTMSYYCIR
jgi:hypothetical protein